MNSSCVPSLPCYQSLKQPPVPRFEALHFVFYRAKAVSGERVCYDYGSDGVLLKAKTSHPERSALGP